MWRNSGKPVSISCSRLFIDSSLAVAKRTLSQVTDFTARKSNDDVVAATSDSSKSYGSSVKRIWSKSSVGACTCWTYATSSCRWSNSCWLVGCREIQSVAQCLTPGMWITLNL